MMRCIFKNKIVSNGNVRDNELQGTMKISKEWRKEETGIYMHKDSITDKKKRKTQYSISSIFPIFLSNEADNWLPK